MIIIRRLLKALGLIDAPTPGKVCADTTRWSEASRRSMAADYTRYYCDIAYVCDHCDAHAVFSAEEQRKAFEVEKRYIWQRRNLCPDCWQERREVERTLRECRETWKERRSTLRNDHGFLTGWLSALELAPEYGIPGDSAHITMVRRMLEASTASEPKSQGSRDV